MKTLTNDEMFRQEQLGWREETLCMDPISSPNSAEVSFAVNQSRYHLETDDYTLTVSHLKNKHPWIFLYGQKMSLIAHQLLVQFANACVIKEL